MTPRSRWYVVVVLLVVACVGADVAPAVADSVRSRQWYLSALGIEQAWSLTRGAGVKVAVIDNGVDGSVPVLRGAVVGGRDFSGTGSADGQAAVTGTSGPDHGTEVASVLAGRGSGPDSGVIGAAPRASLLSCSVTTGTGVNSVQIANAIRWAADNGAKVINISLGTSTDLPAVTAAVRAAEAKDVVVVAGTGDIGAAGFTPPASLPGVVAVSGIDRDLHADPMSSYGHGVAVAGPFATAPGAGIPVALRRGSPNGAYALSEGVSLAAPVVAGIVALIRAKYPAMDAANVINRLIETAKPVGGGTPNDKYGYGIPDAAKALTAQVPSVAVNPLGSLAATRGSAGVPRPGPTRSAPATSAPAATSGSSTGGGGTVWVALAALAVVLAAVAMLLVARLRRPADRRLRT